MRILTGEAPNTSERRTFERRGLAREAASAERILGMRPDVPRLMSTSARSFHGVQLTKVRKSSTARTPRTKGPTFTAVSSSHQRYADPRDSSKRPRFRHSFFRPTLDMTEDGCTIQRRRVLSEGESDGIESA